MNYASGEEIMLGDVVRVPVPDGSARLKVVMLGDTGQHLDIDNSFLTWVKRDRILKSDQIVLEWIDENPFEHDDLERAPVGKYMFSDLDEFLEFLDRGGS